MVQVLQNEHPPADMNGVVNTLAPSSGKFRRALVSHVFVDTSLQSWAFKIKM